ncbi:MAG: enoyl-CoA hydratase/isomerase family protein [Rhodospirillales bacterium]|nr:enoyl-CoA hydratase/isomerase family protein [Rhodospirillales bacterium]
MGAGFQTQVDTRGVATLWLDRPELHNAFDDALIAALTAELGRLAGDASVRVLVLAGRGKSFSAGADLNWMKRMAGYSEAENRRDADALAGLMRVLDAFPKPAIARVQGAAFGGGVGLVACCDIAVAVDTATFCLSEAKLGLIPSVISPYVVAAIGARAARRYFLTAEIFDAAKAKNLGLLHEAVPADALDAAIEAIVAPLLAAGPAAQAECKALVARVSRGPVDDAMVADTAARIARIRVSPEGREGIAAFLEKRKPAWAGRGPR